MPARRLAIRATFNPCSASGMAQPRMTSSIDAASSCGTRSRAPLIAVAASSSGRITLSVPFGALPTAVRTADTMTASCINSRPCCIEVGEQIFNRLADHRSLTLEQMIRVFDRDELLGLGNLRVKPADLLDRDQLVAFPMHDE